MRTLLMLILLSPLACLAQEMSPGPQQSPTDLLQQGSAGPPEAPPPDATITVPAGTRVQLALANPMRTRDAHVGDIVHAVTNFPVTVGQDLAIPQGTYVEGRIARVGKRGSTVFDGLQIESNQLFFRMDTSLRSMAQWPRQKPSRLSRIQALQLELPGSSQITCSKGPLRHRSPK